MALRQIATVGALGIGQRLIREASPIRNPAQPQEIGGNIHPTYCRLVQLQRSLKLPFCKIVFVALFRQDSKVHMVAGLGLKTPRCLIQRQRLAEQLLCLPNIACRLPDQAEIIP